MSINDPLSFFDEDVSTPAATVDGGTEAAAPAPAPAAPSDNLPALTDPAASAAPAAAPAEAPAGSGSPTAATPPAAPAQEDNSEAGLRAALLAERTKRQTLEEVLKSRNEPVQPAPQPEQVEIPAYGTPEYGAFLEQRQMELEINSRLDKSETLATVAHGKELVDAVKTWAQDKDPTWFLGILQSADPYGDAIKQYQMEQNAKSFSEINQDELKAFRDWKAAQAAAQAAQADPAAPAVPAAPAAPAPIVVVPPSAVAATQSQNNPSTPQSSAGSITAMPSASGTKPGEQPAGAGVAFSGAFN